MNTTTAQRVAIERARCIAHRETRRAAELLVAAGYSPKAAGGMALDMRGGAR